MSLLVSKYTISGRLGQWLPLRWLSAEPPNILDFVHGLVAAHLAPVHETVGRVRLALDDFISEADNFCRNGNRRAAPKTKHSRVVLHGEPHHAERDVNLPSDLFGQGILRKGDGKTNGILLVR